MAVNKRIQRSWPRPLGRPVTLRFEAVADTAELRAVASPRAAGPGPDGVALLLRADKPGGFTPAIASRSGLLPKTAASTHKPSRLQGQRIGVSGRIPWARGCSRAIQPQPQAPALRPGRSRAMAALQAGDLDGRDQADTKTCSAACPQPQRQGLVLTPFASLRALRDLCIARRTTPRSVNLSKTWAIRHCCGLSERRPEAIASVDPGWGPQGCWGALWRSAPIRAVLLNHERSDPRSGHPANHPGVRHPGPCSSRSHP